MVQKNTERKTTKGTVF